MGFSQFGGTTLVPTLSRLVLAAAFIGAGYGKFFETTEYTAAQAATLDSLGVTLEPAAAATARSGDAWAVLPAAYVQDEGNDVQADPAGADPAGVDPADAGTQTPPDDAKPPVEAADDPPAAGGETPDGGPEAGSLPAGSGGMYVGKKRHMVTLLCAGQNWPAPTIMSLVVSLTELVGGGLLLIGFLTRIWGLGLAIAMGSAFYLVTLNVNGFELTKPLAFADDYEVFHAAFSQLGLGVLALGLVFTGAGPLSVDRILFGGGKRTTPRTAAVEPDLDDGLG